MDGAANRFDGLFDVEPALAFPAEAGAERVALWRERVRDVVRRRIGDVREPRVVERAARPPEGLKATAFTFGAEGAAAFHATLLQPPRGGAGNLIVVLPGRNAAHAQVIGAEPPDHPGRNVAELLSWRGFATLTLALGLTGALAADALRGRDETSLLAHALALSGRSPLGEAVADVVAALDWAAGQPWCDPQRIGLLGHSLGGHVALHAALVAAKPPPLVLSGCASTYGQLFGARFEGGGASALPGILTQADLSDLIAALAPGPLQLQHGRDDRIFPLADAEPVFAKVARSYGAMAASGSFDGQVLDMGHGTDAERAAAFFERHLPSAAAPPAPVPAARVRFDRRARAEVLERIDAALFTGALTLGPATRELEEMARDATGTPHAAAVSSGTSAVEIALRVVGVKGRPVILPANTFFATVSATLAAGASPLFADMETNGLGTDPESLRRLLKAHPDVAAVVVVHIGGIISPAMDDVAAICERHGVPLVEDAAHALGSRLDGRPAGSFGRLAAFSLYPTKIITSGEGGLVAARDEADDRIVRSLRDHGKVGFNANIHDRIGSNWRMGEAHAAIGLAHMRRLAAVIRERRAAIDHYRAGLASLPGIALLAEPRRSAGNGYKCIATLAADVDRAELKAALRERHGVFLSGEVYDVICPAQPALEGRFRPEDTPVAHAFAGRHICLPLFQGITSAEMDRVVAALRAELGRLRPARAASPASELSHASL